MILRDFIDDLTDDVLIYLSFVKILRVLIHLENTE